MTQIQKHVTSLKISHFIRKHKLVLFFGANKILTQQARFAFAQAPLNKVRSANYAQLGILPLLTAQIGRNEKKHILPIEHHLGLAHTNFKENSTQIDQQPAHLKRDKQLYSKQQMDTWLLGRAGLDCFGNVATVVKSFFSLELSWMLSNSQEKNILLIQNKIARTAVAEVATNALLRDVLIPKPLAIGQNALFQGPVVLLGISDTRQLQELMQLLTTAHSPDRQQESVFLLGGIYNNLLINHVQVNKLAVLGDKGQKSLISSLLYCMRKASCRIASTIHRSALLPVLVRAQHRLLELFIAREAMLREQLFYVRPINHKRSN